MNNSKFHHLAVFHELTSEGTCGITISKQILKSLEEKEHDNFTTESLRFEKIVFSRWSGLRIHSRKKKQRNQLFY
jgi:hypothetical protein